MTGMYRGHEIVAEKDHTGVWRVCVDGDEKTGAFRTFDEAIARGRHFVNRSEGTDERQRTVHVPPADWWTAFGYADRWIEAFA